MRNDELGDLLARWAHWAIAGNRAGLGYAMVAYAERVGSSFSVDNSPPPVDLAILRVDEAIKKLPPVYLRVVRSFYIEQGPVKKKAAELQMSREAFYEYLKHAKEMLAHSMEVFCGTD